MLPFVYTPAVGEACQRYHALPLTPRGLYLSATDAGRFLERLRAWPRQDIGCVGAACKEACLLTYCLVCVCDLARVLCSYQAVKSNPCVLKVEGVVLRRPSGT